MTEVTTAPTQERVAPAPQAPNPGAIKISVSTAPAQTHQKDPSKKRDMKAYIAKENQRFSSMLTENKYKPEAVVAVMRYLRTNRGYGRPSESRGDLVRIFRNLSERLLYRTDIFDRGMSSQIPLTFISTLSKLSSCKSLFDMPDVESTDYVMKALKASWPKGGTDIRDSDIEKIHSAVVYAINPKRPEGFAKRAKYFMETVVDVSLNMVDPFDGLFHTERLEMPKEMRDRIEAARQKNAPKANCPACGKPMIYKFKIAKHFCENPECERYSPPPPPRNRDGERRGPRRDGGYRSGKPVEQVSMVDKFNGKFAKFHKNDKHAPAKKVEERTVAVAAPKSSSGASKGFSCSMAEAFAGLTIGGVDNGKGESETVKQTVQTPPPAPAPEVAPTVPAEETK